MSLTFRAEGKRNKLHGCVLRLDSVASAGFGISRSKTADLIRGEKVAVNWETATNPARLVKEGDTIQSGEKAG